MESIRKHSSGRELIGGVLRYTFCPSEPATERDSGMPHTSTVVRSTTSRLLDQLHRDKVTRTHHDKADGPIVHRMRPYAEQLAFERGEI